MMESEKRTSILQMANGAIQERVDYEMSKIIDNILDPNTSPNGKRKLSLSIEFVPDGERQIVSVRTTAKSTLCPTNPVSTSLWITGDMQGDVTAVEMVPNIPGQLDVFGDEQKPAPVLKIVKNA